MRKIKASTIAFWIGLVGVDILLYFVVGFILMGYEDHYDGTKGPAWSIQSMDNMERLAFITYYAWFCLNGYFVIYLLYRISRKLLR